MCYIPVHKSYSPRVPPFFFFLYYLCRRLHLLMRICVLKQRPVIRGCIQNFRTESITKYMLTTTNPRWEATQRFMAAKLTRLTHKIAIHLHLVAESCIICSSRSRRPVRKLLDTPTYCGEHLGQGRRRALFVACLQRVCYLLTIILLQMVAWLVHPRK
jgi:hypothetical protein